MWSEWINQEQVTIFGGNRKHRRDERKIRGNEARGTGKVEGMRGLKEGMEGIEYVWSE